MTATPACAAAVQAARSLQVACDPPELVARWQWSAALTGDPAGQSAFKAWLAGHQARAARLQAASERAARVLRVGSDLVAAIPALKAEVEAESNADLDLPQLVGLGCALSELHSIQKLIDTSSGVVQDTLADITALVPAGA